MNGIYVLGTGYVGQAFARRGVQPVSRIDIDYTNRNVFRAFLRDRMVSTIINAAGFTGGASVDGCEGKWKETIAANIVLPAMLSEVCKDEGVRFVHVSSGCIYQGRRPDGGGWKETDTPNFHGSLYSRTKALAEPLVDGYVLRMRMPFGGVPHPRNLLTKLLNYLRIVGGENSVTSLEDFVDATFAILKYGTPGVYNVTNRGTITTLQIVELVNRYKEWHPEWFTREEFDAVVPTPRSFCVLDTDKLEALYQMPLAKVAVEQSVKQLLEGKCACPAIHA